MTLSTKEWGMYNLAKVTFFFSCLDFSVEKGPWMWLCMVFKFFRDHIGWDRGSVKGLLTFHISSHHIYPVYFSLYFFDLEYFLWKAFYKFFKNHECYWIRKTMAMIYTYIENLYILQFIIGFYIHYL